MEFVVCKNYDEMSAKAAEVFAQQIKSKPDTVLGLATGSTPLGLYGNLAGMGLDFSRVKTYNLDEYYPISPDNDQSYRYFMNKNLFDRINIDKNNTHVPNGLAEDPVAEGIAYDKAIREAGGIDMQLLGVGNNGHVGFNEPADELVAATHLTGLTQSTIQANSRFFEKESDVPTQALTMGMTSIMTARRVVFLISGKNKHNVLKLMMEGRITTACPATLLLGHPNCIVFCDEEAYNG